MSHPALPEPAHADQDSMLSRKFGREVANYFSGMLLLHLLSSSRDMGAPVYHLPAPQSLVASTLFRPSI